jgi:hypothetical protein
MPRAGPEFFTTDPTSYFRSRIDALLDWVDQANSDHKEISAELRRFQDILGPAASARYPTTAEQRRLHVAVDAVQLRHDAAEALLRLIHARLGCRKSTQPHRLWMALIQTPTQLHNLVEELRAQVESEDFGPILAGQIIARAEWDATRSRRGGRTTRDALDRSSGSGLSVRAWSRLILKAPTPLPHDQHAGLCPTAPTLIQRMPARGASCNLT